MNNNLLNLIGKLFGVLVLLCSSGLALADPGDWHIGPFSRPDNAQPVITPNPQSVFDCPMLGKPVHWEATHTFNPRGGEG